VSAVALKNLAEIERNGVAPEQIGGGTRYLGLEHIESGGRILGSETVATGDLASAKFRFTPDHLLFGKLRPYLAKIALPDFAGICSTDILPVRPGPELDRRYLAFFLRQPSIVDLASSRATGANLPRLSPKALGEIEIPWRPLPEQRRIAAILDQADALRRLRRQSLARLSDLGQAIFFEMFGSGSEDANIALTPLASAAKLINGDRSSNYPSGEDLVDDGILFLSTRNIVDGGIDLSHRQFITMDKFNSLGGGKLARGDVVITLRGSTGLSAVFDTEYETGFINAQLMIIRCNDHLLPQYLQKYLSLSSTQHRLKKEGSGSAVPQLTGAQMKEFKILVPPIDQQLAFIEAYADLQDHVSNALLGSRKLDSLFASLQHRAFRGEL